MDKSFTGSIIAIVLVLGGILAAGFAGLQTQTASEMHSYSDVHGGVRQTVTWTEPGSATE